MRAAAALALALVIVVGLGSDRIEEDSPLWQCATMGNLQCGGER